MLQIWSVTFSLEPVWSNKWLGLRGFNFCIQTCKMIAPSERPLKGISPEKIWKARSAHSARSILLHNLIPHSKSSLARIHHFSWLGTQVAHPYYGGVQVLANELILCSLASIASFECCLRQRSRSLLFGVFDVHRQECCSTRVKMSVGSK